MTRATGEVPLQDSRSVRGTFCSNSHVRRFLSSNSGVNTINSYVGFELNFKSWSSLSENTIAKRYWHYLLFHIPTELDATPGLDLHWAKNTIAKRYWHYLLFHIPIRTWCHPPGPLAILGLIPLLAPLPRPVSVGGLHFRSSIQLSIPTHTYIYKHLHFQAPCSCCFPHSPQVKSWWGLVNWVWSLITEYPSFESCIQSPVTRLHLELFFNASQHSKWSVLLHSSALHL